MKLLISESQLEVLISHINESQPTKKIIKEGWREVVLGTAMLMGVKLTGVNAETATNALNDPKTIKEIEDALSSQKIERLADTLEQGGLKDAMNKIQANSFKIITNLSLAADEHGISSNVSIYNSENIKKS